MRTCFSYLSLVRLLALFASLDCIYCMLACSHWPLVANATAAKHWKCVFGFKSMTKVVFGNQRRRFQTFALFLCCAGVVLAQPGCSSKEPMFPLRFQNDHLIVVLAQCANARQQRHGNNQLNVLRYRLVRLVRLVCSQSTCNCRACLTRRPRARNENNRLRTLTLPAKHFKLNVVVNTVLRC